VRVGPGSSFTERADVSPTRVVSKEYRPLQAITQIKAVSGWSSPKRLGLVKSGPNLNNEPPFKVDRIMYAEVFYDISNKT